MSDIETVPLDSLQPDSRNVNRHTERGEYAIRKSLEKFGFAEAGTLDANNRIVGGNLRTEAAADVLNANDAIIIDVDGTKPVYIRRKDIDLETARGRELAIALNRVPQLSIEFDAMEIDSHLDDGVDLDDWFRLDELDALHDGEDADLKEPSEHRTLGDKNRQIKAVLYSDQIDILERAILATGERNRGAALIQICEAYLSETGQFDFQV